MPTTIWEDPRYAIFFRGATVLIRRYARGQSDPGHWEALLHRLILRVTDDGDASGKAALEQDSPE